MSPGANIRRALVTGAAGFLGRRLVARLHAGGVETITLSRSSGFDLLTDPIPVDGCDMVFHLAGRTYVVDAWREPADFHLVNAHGTVRVLEACARSKTPIVYASAYVYGAPQRLPIDEAHPVMVNNPYAFSKFMGEEACRFFSSSFGVEATLLRIFNIYGPGQERHFLIPTILEQILDPQIKEIVVADLGPRRDYLYVDDLIDAIMAIAGIGGVFNIGSGRSCSVRELIEGALAATGVDKPFRDRGERRQNEVDDVIADISSICRRTGWSPRTTLQRGLSSMVNAR